MGIGSAGVNCMHASAFVMWFLAHMAIHSALGEVGRFCEGVPIHAEIGALSFCTIVGCGVGVGAGTRVHIRSRHGGSTFTSSMHTIRKADFVIFVV